MLSEIRQTERQILYDLTYTVCDTVNKFTEENNAMPGLEEVALSR